MEQNEMDEKKEYEVAFLAKEEGDVAELRMIIGQHNGDITFEGPVRRINLAYKIKKESQAHFGYFYVHIVPSDVPALNHDLLTRSKLTRFMVIRAPGVKAKTLTSVKPRSIPPKEIRPVAEPKIGVAPLSNEALEKKIEEILQ